MDCLIAIKDLHIEKSDFYAMCPREWAWILDAYIRQLKAAKG